jgi:ubiquinone/menaquinone biosynthesis C-methylase UbiE
MRTSKKLSKTSLKANEENYVRRAFSHGIGYYEDRLRDMGLGNMERALDIGCGPGHWTIAAARLNEQVIGVDRSLPFLFTARKMSRKYGMKNLDLILCDAQCLPFIDRPFNGVVCYLVLPYVDDKKVLHETSRILRRGGKVFLGCHGIGYYLSIVIMGNGKFGRRMNVRERAKALEITMRGLFYNITGRRVGQTFQTVVKLRKMMNKVGIRVCRVILEPPEYGMNAGNYPRKFLGFPIKFAIQAEKT